MPDPAPLVYRVTPARPRAHLFECELLIPASDADGDSNGDADGDTDDIRLWLPAWIPGSYMIRDFARNIVALSATQPGDGPGTGPRIAKLDKQTWRLTGVRGPVLVRWTVYAWELSVRAAHLDETHGYFNGAALLLAVAGREADPCRLTLCPPPDAIATDWRVATSLTPDGAAPWGFGDYRADNYADLIDHPVELGRFAEVGFAVAGVPHWLVLSGRQRADRARLGRDLARVCAEHAALFGELPVQGYLFLTQVVGNGYGGLEHRASTSLLVSRADLPLPADEALVAHPVPRSVADAGPGANASPAAEPGEGYRRLLGLMSHEYFHLWHVLRIRPRALIDGALTAEVHTRTLWAFEGITSYYDDLALRRAGLIDANAYLGLLAETITRVLRTPGRRRQSVAESSFDAWTRFYKQDDNAPNAIISYYAKGALVALALDLTLRRVTGGARSLDDLMRALWQRHGRTGVGVGERGIEALAVELAGAAHGAELTAFFASAVDGTDDLDLAGLLADVGVQLRLRPARGARDVGGAVDAFAPLPPPLPDLGLRLAPDLAEAQVAAVIEDRPAQRAGLAGGDIIIAIDGLRANAANLEALVGALPCHVPVTVHAFRRDELMAFEVCPEPAPTDTCELFADPAASADALARRAAWWRPNAVSAAPQP